MANNKENNQDEEAIKELKWIFDQPYSNLWEQNGINDLKAVECFYTDTVFRYYQAKFNKWLEKKGN